MLATLLLAPSEKEARATLNVFCLARAEMVQLSILMRTSSSMQPLCVCVCIKEAVQSWASPSHQMHITLYAPAPWCARNKQCIHYLVCPSPLVRKEQASRALLANERWVPCTSIFIPDGPLWHWARQTMHVPGILRRQNLHKAWTYLARTTCMQLAYGEPGSSSYSVHSSS